MWWLLLLLLLLLSKVVVVELGRRIKLVGKRRLVILEILLPIPLANDRPVNRWLLRLWVEVVLVVESVIVVEILVKVLLLLTDHWCWLTCRAGPEAVGDGNLNVISNARPAIGLVGSCKLISDRISLLLLVSCNGNWRWLAANLSQQVGVLEGASTSSVG